ncbi:MAG: class I SAM-dependent methyltransferase [Thermoleophilia bacterium]
MTLFQYKEPSFYLFGLKMGLKNLAHNHFQLGPKKTFGKIFQPINFYTRFPEYAHFLNQLENYVHENESSTISILDVGSPKLFGFYLASQLPVNLLMTDISKLNIDEYIVIWEALKNKAPGHIKFEFQDVRSLSCAPESFDAVFCMSVLEHAEGVDADKTALVEMLRVLRKGGMFIFSVPIGNKEIEQLRPSSGVDHQGLENSDNSFFQRIYSYGSIEKRLMPELRPHLTETSTSIIIRKPSGLLRRYLNLGQTARGALGFINPVMSAIYNDELHDPRHQIPSDYGEQHSARDIYGDFIYCGIKK